MEQTGEWYDGELAIPRVLVVDDDCAIRLLLRESLEDAGCVVEEVGDGLQALALLEVFRPDLVLMDVVMPEIDGFQTCRRIHELRGFEQLPVLMMTGLDDVESINRAYDSGAVDVLLKPLNWVALMHRIRQLMEIERLTRRLDEAELRQQALLDAAGILLIRLRLDGRMSEIRAGSGMREFAETKSWPGQRIQDVVPPEAAGRFMKSVKQSLQSNGCQHTLQAFSFGGDESDYELRAISNGAEEMTVVVKPAKRPFDEASSWDAGFFRTLVDASPDPMFVLNSAGRIEYENRSATMALRNGKKGRSHIRVGGALDFVHSEDADPLFNGIVETLKSPGDTHRIEFRVGDRHGAWRMWDGEIVNLFEEPDVGGLFLTCRDITRFKENEADLVSQKTKAEAMDQAKSEYLAVVSHELRSPLNTIMGHADLMLEDMPGSLTASQVVSLRRIRKSAREVLDLTFSVLDLTRLEAGALPLDRQEVSVADVLQEIRDETDTECRTGVDVCWHVDDHLRTLYTDRAKIKMIMRNLVNNAMKFTRVGRVTVDALQQDGHVEMRVTDTGVGISRDQQHLMFEPFGFVRENATCYEGGLGLYIVQRFVALLGGEIRVESTPGEGTCFTVALATNH